MKRSAVFCIVLAACAEAQTIPPLPENDSCDAISFGAVIGQPVTALERVLYLGKIRVVRPGDAVTMDFQPDRVNVLLDSRDRIDAIRCG